MTVKNAQAKTLVKWVHQVIYNILVTKYLDKKALDSMDLWSEKLASIAWEISESYYWTIGNTPGWYVFIRDMILNLASVIYRKVITVNKQRQVNIDKFWKNSSQVSHDYAVENLVYVYKTGIYHKLGYEKYGPYKSISTK